MADDEQTTPQLSRRNFMIIGGVSMVGASATRMPPTDAQPACDQQGPSSRNETARTSRVQLTVNGKAYLVEIDPNDTLLDALREHVGLTGTKRGCDVGACGACTVLLDGNRVNACLMLALMADGSAVTTIEGVGSDGGLHPVQRAFIDRDGLQCGYCTPGQIMSSIGYLAEGHSDSTNPSVIREWMSGNLCRCGAYPNIVAAIGDVAGIAPRRVGGD